MNWQKHQDKKLHFGGGFIAALFISIFYGFAVSFVAVWVIGHAKEEYDRQHPENHTEEARDALATSTGGFCGAWLGTLFGGIL